MALYDYQIASGFNNAGSLVNVENITDGSGRAFFAPEIIPIDVDIAFTVGQADSQTGYEVFQWRMLMTSEQYSYWQTTYANGGYSGNVTVRSVTQQLGTYANYNAYMRIPTPANSNRLSDSYKVVITFAIDEAL